MASGSPTTATSVPSPVQFQGLEKDGRLLWLCGYNSTAHKQPMVLLTTEPSLRTWLIREAAGADGVVDAELLHEIDAVGVDGVDRAGRTNIGSNLASEEYSEAVPGGNVGMSAGVSRRGRAERVRSRRR